MAKILTESDIFAEIENMVSSAKKFIVIISPYVSIEMINRILYLRNNNSSDVFLQIYCLSAYKHFNFSDKEKFDKEKKTFDDYFREISKFKNNRNFLLHPVDVLYDDPCLLDSSEMGYRSLFHCKCFFNEERFIISSMNLSSRVDRCELGILFYMLKNKKIYESLISWYLDFFCLKVHGEKYDKSYLFDRHKFGACIRCGCNIFFNYKFNVYGIEHKSESYCKLCYIDWGLAGAKNCKEVYCHFCGNENNSICTLLPVERSCLDKYRSLLPS